MLKRNYQTIGLILALWFGVNLVLCAQQSYYEMDLRALLNVKIRSASKIEEPIAESIVPVTLITQAMIRNSGARTLKDLLITFVPGMTFVQDQNEVNVAMRGVFTSSQQKILILLEGHRLNSRVISAANPDHAIGLDKIKQIEVLRGPGSSVYGNVALTAVINIVLKKGAELEGAELAIASGDHGQKKLSFNYGTKLGEKGELFAWLYHYQNAGEKVAIRPENDYARNPSSQTLDSIIGGFFDKPALDIGTRITYKNWSFLANKRRAHYIEPFTSASLTGEAYNYEDYPKRYGIGPGFQYTFLHTSLANKLPLSKDTLWENRIYYDESDMEATFILVPSIQMFGQGTMYDRTKGINTQFNVQKNWGRVLTGYQFEQMEVYKSDFPFGTQGQYTGDLFTDENPLLRSGKETIQSLYSMLKYHLSDSWLTNIGFRFDQKDRLTLSNQHNLSPRLGVVYQGKNDFQLKISYAESFVDSPYWNRYGALPAFRGSETLKPEKLHSFQLTPSWQLFENKLSYELNLFYNHLHDAVFRNNSAAIDEPINTNAGKIETWGHEHQLIYRGKNWSARIVGFFNSVIETHDFLANDDEIFNIPNETFNIILDKQWSDTISSHIAFNYQSAQLSPINISFNGEPVADPYPDSGVDYQLPNHRLSSRVITNFGLAIGPLFGKNLRFEIQAFNLFDVDYQQGGTTLHPYQQEGRWLLAQLRYQF